MSDAVDAAIDQWAAVRPDLTDDLGAMALIGRLGRVVGHITQAVTDLAAGFGLDVGELDALFALRRSGDEGQLTPTALARTMLLSPAGVTSRVDRLERAALVERRPDPDDRRSVLVRLTEAGRELADRMVTEHLAREVELLAPLTEADRRALDRGLRRLLRSFEPPGGGS